jgi:hypothetical protein
MQELSRALAEGPRLLRGHLFVVLPADADVTEQLLRRCPECGYEEMPGELRNNLQNRRYWKVIVERVRGYLERKKGYAISKHTVHDGLKAGYLGMVENPFGGPPLPRSTTGLSRKAMAEVQDRIQADFSQLGVDFEEHREAWTDGE